MKLHQLIYNKKALGVRFYFPKMKLAYDVPLDMFLSYFSDLDMNMIRRYMNSCGTIKLKDNGNLLVSDAELSNQYKVVSVEDESSIAGLYEMFVLDHTMDKGSVYRYKSFNPQLDNGSLLELIEVNAGYGSCLVVTQNNLDYCVKTNELRKVKQ